jgi:glutaryl-CoA dehydrogenase
MAGKFEGTDFCDVDSLLSEKERVMPLIGQAYIKRRFPRELILELGKMGMLGANLPEEYGRAGLNKMAYDLIAQELGRGDSGIRSFASVQGALVMYPIFLRKRGAEDRARTTSTG